MTTTIVYATNPVWEVSKVSKKWRVTWRGAPGVNPGPLLEPFGIEMARNSDRSMPITVAKAIEVIVGLGLTVHWQVPGSAIFKNRLREALNAAEIAGVA